MKKYFAPELTISSFDVEDIIAVSGVPTSDIATEAGNTGWISTGGGAGSVEGTGVYFSWDAH